MFLQSAALAILSSELAAYLLKRQGQLTPHQIALAKALIAATTGGVCAVTTVDPLGGVMTVPVVLRALTQTEMPPEMRNVLNAMAPLVNCLMLTSAIETNPTS